MNADQMRRLIRAAAVVRDGGDRQKQYTRERYEADLARLLNGPATPPISPLPGPIDKSDNLPPFPRPQRPSPVPLSEVLNEHSIREMFFGELLEFARGHYPTDVSSSGRGTAESLVSSVFSSFFRGHTQGRAPEWQSQEDFWQALLEITLAKIEQRRKGERPDILTYPGVESRTVVETLGETCWELYEQETGSEFERNVMLLKLQRNTPSEIAGELSVPVEEVRIALMALHAKLAAKATALKAVKKVS